MPVERVMYKEVLVPFESRQSGVVSTEVGPVTYRSPVRRMYNPARPDLTKILTAVLQDFSCQNIISARMSSNLPPVDRICALHSTFRAFLPLADAALDSVPRASNACLQLL